MQTASTRPLTAPLVGSLLVTAAVVTFVCEPPAHQLRSWGQVATLASLYLLSAAAVHALAVWGVCRVQEEDDAGWRSFWNAIRIAWVAIVWLPLIALLTKENSPWVAAFLPVTAVFGALLLRQSSASDAAWDDFLDMAQRPPAGLFELRETPPLWRVLLPGALMALAAETAFVLLANNHAWIAGCLLAAAVCWLMERWLAGRSQISIPGEGSWRRTSLGNSLLVWLLLSLALVPFVASYVAAEFGLIPHRKLQAPPRVAGGTRSGLRGYTGIILLTPRKPHEAVTPTQLASTSAPGTPKVIHFDGSYWYFQQPDTKPGARARIERGDPVKNRVFTTDQMPLVMEAHQPLGRPVAWSCCRSVLIHVKNADSRPGKISLEILLGNTLPGSKSVSLGTQLLASSAVSPMPLNRPPVDDKLTFHVPKNANGRTFDEITVRLIPEQNRSLAGAQVAIQDFVLQP
jgi:hypothetical protein